MKEQYLKALHRLTLKELALAYRVWRMEPQEFWDLIAEARNV